MGISRGIKETRETAAFIPFLPGEQKEIPLYRVSLSSSFHHTPSSVFRSLTIHHTKVKVGSDEYVSAPKGRADDTLRTYERNLTEWTKRDVKIYLDFFLSAGKKEYERVSERASAAGHVVCRRRRIQPYFHFPLSQEFKCRPADFFPLPLLFNALPSSSAKEASSFFLLISGLFFVYIPCCMRYVSRWKRRRANSTEQTEKDFH